MARPEPHPDRPPLWRVLHDKEIGPLWRSNLPEVFPFAPNHFSQFTRPWQMLSFSMNQPWLTKAKWTRVYWHNLWIANHQGFGMETDPRRNYVLETNMDKSLPRVEALTCGGNVLTGTPVGDQLLVDTWAWRDSPPDVTWMMAHPWFVTYAVTVDQNGVPRRFPQGMQPNGYMADVVHPLLCDPTRFVITFPMSLLQRWDEEELPDPYTLYLV